MKTALELLLNCPDEQIKRLTIVIRSISNGRWGDAAHHLRNAAKESEQYQCVFAQECRELAEHCQKNADMFKL